MRPAFPWLAPLVFLLVLASLAGTGPPTPAVPHSASTQTPRIQDHGAGWGNGTITASGNLCQGGSITGANLTFTARAWNGTPPYTFTWSFGDGTPDGSGQVTTHLYQVWPLPTNATLTVIDSAGMDNVSTVPLSAPFSLGCPVTVQRPLPAGPLTVDLALAAFPLAILAIVVIRRWDSKRRRAPPPSPPLPPAP